MMWNCRPTDRFCWPSVESKNRISRKGRRIGWARWKLPKPGRQKSRRQKVGKAARVRRRPRVPRSQLRARRPAWSCLRRCGSTRRRLWHRVVAPIQKTCPIRLPLLLNRHQAVLHSSHILPSSGTVVLEVEQGGILVPSFLGKSVRSAIETAQENGLDLDAVGNGLAREQSPPPGSHVASGSSITVKFGR